MNKREYLLDLIQKIAATLPDEEIRALETFADFLKVKARPEPVLDWIIGDLRRLGEEKRSVLYSILFREAGIGFQWWEEKRAGPEPSPEWRKAEPGELLTMTYQDELKLWNKRGLVIYNYYPSLSEAIREERKRLEEYKP